MNNRKIWVITGTIGILAAGTGAAFASQPSATGDKDVARTTVTDNATTQAQTPGTSVDDAHGVTLTTPDPQAIIDEFEPEFAKLAMVTLMLPWGE